MKILLIGNGFDLEHNLPTTYVNFLEFCQKARCIYTYIETKDAEYYQNKNLSDWKIDSSISNSLLQAFQSKCFHTTTSEEGTICSSVITPNKYLDELCTLISKNTWLEYF